MSIKVGLLPLSAVSNLVVAGVVQWLPSLIAGAGYSREAHGRPDRRQAELLGLFFF
jgi:hypothetical protein